MEQDERTVVRQAQNVVQQSLREHGRVLPGAVILAHHDPESGEPLPAPAALAMSEDKPFEDEAAFELFVGGLRAETRRLGATAIALIGEAGAEVEGSEGVRRVALIRMEDRGGVQLLHAPIELQPDGGMLAGDFVASPEAPDILEHPIL